MYWNELLAIGTTLAIFRRHRNLIVKPEKYEVAKKIFEGTNVDVTQTGKRHFGAVIGNLEYKHEYMSNMIRIWNQQLECLSSIGETASCKQLI